MPNELKPCPFCGGKPQMFACDGSGSFFAPIGTTQFWGRKLDHFLIRCTACGVRTKAYKTNRGVFNAWNRRVDNG
jgi:Lar family restriction alleviation protein